MISDQRFSIANPRGNLSGIVQIPHDLQKGQFMSNPQINHLPLQVKGINQRAYIFSAKEAGSSVEIGSAKFMSLCLDLNPVLSYA